MKWGRTPSPPTFRSSVIGRVFPGTWFSKFKQTNGSHDAAIGKKQQRGKLDFSPANPSRRREARFYSLDNDPYWTLSFRKDRGEGKRRIQPLWYDTEEEFQAAVSSLEGYGVERRELESIDEIMDTNQMEQGECSRKIVPKNGALRKKSGRRSRKLRSRVQRKKKKKKEEEEEEEVVDDGEEELSSAKEETDESDGGKEEFQDSRNHQNLSSQNFWLSSIEEDCEDGHAFTSDASSERESNFESQNLDNKKFEENEVKSESEREDAYLSRRFYNRKTKRNRKKAHVPRSECRIQALEDLNKARIKLKKEAEEQATESSTIYNSFAVVKSSFNPQEDFRDSMAEMIRVKGIRRREELEELLACYLTLNSDGHHDLIIDAFQQVWFEMSGGVY